MSLIEIIDVISTVLACFSVYAATVVFFDIIVRLTFNGKSCSVTDHVRQRAAVNKLHQQTMRVLGNGKEERPR